MYLSDALTTCEQAARTELNMAQACRTLGNMLQSMGRLSEALNWHTRAAQLPPDRREIFAGIGRLYADQQQWSAAIAAYEAALELDASYDKAHWSLANIYGLLGQPTAEIHHRQQAFQINPRFATPNNQLKLGNRLWSTDDTAAAIECYREALAHQPDFFEAHYNLAVALIRQSEWQAAIAALHRSLELIPDYAPTYYCLGRVSYQQREWHQAQSYFQEAVAIDPHYMLAWSALGEVSLKLHQWQLAQSAYEQAIELGGDFPWNYHNLGYALLRQTDTGAALVWLQRAVALSFDTPWFPLHLGEALIQADRWQEALSTLIQAAQIHQNLPQTIRQDLPELYGLLGRVLKQQLRQNPTAIALDPQVFSVDFSRQVAEQLAAQQQYDGAVWLYEIALGQARQNQSELDPDQPELDRSKSKIDEPEPEPSELDQSKIDEPEPEPEPSEIDQIQALQQQLEQAQLAQQELQQTIADYYWNLEKFPEQFWRYAQLAHLLADQGETAAAIALHRTALGLRGWQTAVNREYCFSRDWFTHNIPVWREYLADFAGKTGIQALEIGCFEGMASCWLFDHILTADDARLTCIDPYGQDYFLTNLDRAQATEKTSYWMAESHQILSRLTPEHYQIIYISGSPLADDMQQDGALAWQLLTPGGILIFDYYGWIDQEPIEQQSHIGIDAFLQTVQQEVEVLHRDYQVIVRKLKY